MKIEADLRLARHMIQFLVAGFRSDKEWFTLPILIDREQMNRLGGLECLEGFHNALSSTLAQLETFRDCDCFPSKQIRCRTHDTQLN